MEKFYNLRYSLENFLLIITTLCAIIILPLDQMLVSAKPKHFVIHVPMKMRSHHHTHTVFSHISGGGGSASKGSQTKQTVYKIMGYDTTHHMAGLRHANNHRNHHHNFHGHRSNHMAADLNYDDYNCDTSGAAAAHAAGDMIFNHYSRHDKDYAVPDITDVDQAAADVEEEEEFIEDDQQGDEWE